MEFNIDDKKVYLKSIDVFFRQIEKRSIKYIGKNEERSRIVCKDSYQKWLLKEYRAAHREKYIYYGRVAFRLGFIEGAQLDPEPFDRQELDEILMTRKFHLNEYEEKIEKLEIRLKKHFDEMEVIRIWTEILDLPVAQAEYPEIMYEMGKDYYGFIKAYFDSRNRYPICTETPNMKKRKKRRKEREQYEKAKSRMEVKKGIKTRGQVRRERREARRDRRQKRQEERMARERKRQDVKFEKEWKKKE